MRWHRSGLAIGLAVAGLLTAVACGGSDGAASPATTGSTAVTGPVVVGSAVATTAPTSAGATSASSGGTVTPGAPAQLRLEVLARYPHDTGAFTQGLVLDQGELFESTGLNGQSTVREVDLTTGVVTRSTALDATTFGEGLALVGDRLILLTWRNGVAYTYQRDTFAPLGTIRYSGEGWGLCAAGDELVMSNGSANLTVRDPATFAVTRTVEVRDGAKAVDQLNELECVGDHVFANVWLTSRIARIDLRTGVIDGWLDATSLVPPNPGRDDVLNGIAYDAGNDTFLLTGKRWPTMYRVRLS